MMLQTMRDNAQSWVAKVIVGVIVLIFALTGWESISRFTSDEDKAADVNDITITRAELEQSASLQRRQLVEQMRQMGNDIDPSMIDENLLRASVLDSLIERALLIDAAQSADLQITEGMIDQLILSTPDFQANGEFDANRFDAAIRNMGLGSRMAFRDLVRQELLLAQYRNAFQATAFATPAENERLARLENQTRDFSVIEVPLQNDGIEVSEEEAKAYYEENTQRFMTAEKVVLETLTLSRSDYFDEVAVDEEALEALYQREIGNLSEQRRASHILFEVNDETTEEEALEQAQAVRQQLEQGDEFDALAEQHSDDPGSASQGGDLGFTARGDFDEAFDEALFALDVGDVSDPVLTTYGYHLIKLTEAKAPDVPSLDEMRPRLVEELKTEQVERRFVEATQELANLAYESSDLEQPARELGLEIETVGPVERSGGEGITANPRIMMAAFDEEVLVEGRNSQPIELDAETVVVLRVKDHQQPRQRPLDEVRAEVEDLVRYRKATEETEQLAETLVARMRSGEQDQQAVAEQLSTSWERHEAVGRSSNSLPAGLVRSVFALPRPTENEEVYGQVRQTDGSRWLVRLTGVATPIDAAEEASNEAYQQFVSGQTGDQDFSAVQEHLREQAEIERY
ncbi:SurA N-terminal domain-containing protein [Halopseudomonas nanhaiensis]|uniref:SurA N-terminal domain-containing protein n=1 Tax=Halopseudomonas nanhaiensis TaxID=2830842 RepID=UPI001CC05A4C|nr:SurA N-terminal domain-containing protein [Halopseudomonas nanhaiensis]UAW97035.1 SurA N-terminal domain-containing protein [Halopseudomonas nanhaiensis]